METTLTATLKGSTMEKIFDNSKILNVRHYKALDLKEEKDYKASKKYKYEILVRHSEHASPGTLLQQAIEEVENTKRKKIFLVSTEKGRVRGKISFYIAEIVPNKGLRLIDNDFVCSIQSNRGIESEAVQALINRGELPITARNEAGYRDGRVNNYKLIIIEGQGLNYINQY